MNCLYIISYSINKDGKLEERNCMEKLKLVFLFILFIIVNVALVIESPWYMLVHPITILILFIKSKFGKRYTPHMIEMAVGIPWTIVLIMYFDAVL